MVYSIKTQKDIEVILVPPITSALFCAAPLCDAWLFLLGEGARTQIVDEEPGALAILVVLCLIQVSSEKGG